MAQTGSRDKGKIIEEFETMKSFELSARELYDRIARDDRTGEPKVRDAFTKLAEDEQRHAELVQEIINIVSNAL